MSKDKGTKNKKKVADKSAGKGMSDYKSENKSSKDKNAAPAAFAPKPDQGGGSHKAR